MSKRNRKKTDETDKKESDNSLTNAALTGAAGESVQRYGSAVKEHIVSLSGSNSETSETLKRSLQSISRYKTNSSQENHGRNIVQQAGFSAEVKETARENAERIIKGDTSRLVRTDDIGSVNDQLHDHVLLDAGGNPIDGSFSQMKFVGKDSKSLLNKLASVKNEKYLNNGCKIKVPSDYYDDVKSLIPEEIQRLERQAESATQKGDIDAAQKYKERITRYKKIDNSLEKSRLSKSEAIEARLYPLSSTVKDIVRVSHRAGVESVKYGAVIGGGISGIRNIVAVVKGDKTSKEALADSALDTSKAVAVSYSAAFVGSTIKGAMQNAPTQFIRSLSRTNLPAIVAITGIETTKTITQYFSGKIDISDCFIELGGKNASMISAAMFASAGQVLLPIPVIGGLIGGMIGYAFSSAYYNLLANALKDKKLAREYRLYVESELKETIAAIREYRLEVEQIISKYLSEHREVFSSAFDTIKVSLNTGDTDGFISGVNSITRKLGGSTLYESLDEFNAIMANPKPIRL